MNRLIYILPLLITMLVFNSCEEEAVRGCMDTTACNYDSTATEADDASCVYAEPGYDCDGNCADNFMAGNNSYELDGQAVIIDYGCYDDYYYTYYDYDTGESYDYFYEGYCSGVIGLPSSGLTFDVVEGDFVGTGSLIGMAVITDDDGMTVGSTYNVSTGDYYEINSIGYGLYDANYDANSDGTEIASGSMTLDSFTATTIELSFDFTDENGNAVVGCYSGPFDYYEYYYRHQELENNFRSKFEILSKNR